MSRGDPFAKPMTPGSVSGIKEIKGKSWCPEADSNHRHADFQSKEQSQYNKHIDLKKYQDKAGTSAEPDTSASSTDLTANENPGALAGATGADVQSTEITYDHTAFVESRHPIIALHWGIAA
ncbi:hypothetical protein [Paracoccus sp. SCSIO 75233]|uniref:hypothetical protein n=1 Tax=Paracoccus sp. SCSIO 75233 TaxID=3017782 RepID=UPI0022EFE1A0|nr:hypothetical protein [Paracoccus sp. SCSIO 75233]WBU53341.1 hypothetical protein PAF12_00420 [Paracoccus sp. SCSIO 75233]